MMSLMTAASVYVCCIMLVVLLKITSVNVFLFLYLEKPVELIQTYCHVDSIWQCISNTCTIAIGDLNRKALQFVIE